LCTGARASTRPPRPVPGNLHGRWNGVRDSHLTANRYIHPRIARRGFSSPAGPSASPGHCPTPAARQRRAAIQAFLPLLPCPSVADNDVGAVASSSARPDNHRPRPFTLIACRARRDPAMPFGHALLEHEIGRHSRLGCRIGILPADLQHRGRVIVGLARLLRAHQRVSAHHDDRCANKAFERRSRNIPYCINHRLAGECYGPGYCPAPTPEARLCTTKPRKATSAVGPSHSGVDAATAVTTNAYAGATTITTPGPTVRNVAHRICATHPTQLPVRASYQYAPGANLRCAIGRAIAGAAGCPLIV
jgi:hypothetical protein